MKREEAMKILKDFHDYSALFSVRTALDTIIPELKENNDERIRKAISQCVEDMRGQFEKLYGVHHKDVIAWLEKQGEQKLTWNKEDEIGFGDALWAIEQARTIAKDENDMGNLWYAEKWLKSIKDRVWLQPEQCEQESLCDKCKKENAFHSCQDITELGRYAVEQKSANEGMYEF